MTIAFTVACVLLVISGLGCAVLWRQRRQAIAERDDLQADLDTARQSNAQLDKDLALLRQQQADDQRRLNEFKEQIDKRMKELTNDALNESRDRFLKQAKQLFQHEQEKSQKNLDAHRQSVDALIKPVKESLDKYQQWLREIEKTREGAYKELRQQVQALSGDQQRLRQETAKLARALRRPETRGRWGEMQLRRVAELAGMIDHCDFTEQPSVGGEGAGGLQRPDMLVNLPSNRTIVVDAKTPLDAFLDAVDSDEESQRQEHLARHAAQIEGKVNDLAKKQYTKHLDRTPDFVVLFIPGESFLQAAVEQRPTLLETAMDKGVIIATPTTLISLLRAVAVGWREEQIAENARRIGEVARELYERVEVMIGHVQTHGKALRRAVDSYEKIKRSAESRVMVTGRELKKLGLESSKEYPERMPEIEVTSALPGAQQDADSETDDRSVETQDHSDNDRSAQTDEPIDAAQPTETSRGSETP